MPSKFWKTTCYITLSALCALADETKNEFGILSSSGVTDQELMLSQKTPAKAVVVGESDPNILGNTGTSPLMEAVQNGDFDLTRKLLWQGGDPRIKNAKGKSAIDLIPANHPDALSLELILRCYIFVLSEGDRSTVTPKEKNTVLVSDMFVEPDHPKYRSAYVRNKAELNGKPGVDDDGNGLIDDVDGWNFMNNRPARSPRMGLDGTQDSWLRVKSILDQYELASFGSGPAAVQAKKNLENSVNNPIVAEIGLQPLAVAGKLIDDWSYAVAFTQASHGTHVAGIAYDASEKKALLRGSNWGTTEEAEKNTYNNGSALLALASKAKNYDEYVELVLETERGNSARKGKMASRYLKHCGAGVVNMSWGKAASGFQNGAKSVRAIYSALGKNVASMGGMSPSPKVGSREDLAQELATANAAAYALLFYENPDVLFVIAAGNEGLNNDLNIPSPQYLSVFFPNVITVAAHDSSGALCSFSNYGLRSVQLSAPGFKIMSSLVGGFQGRMNGTSMAAPYVAGLAAGIRKDYPTLRAHELRHIIESTIDKRADYVNRLNSPGLVNPVAARQMAASVNQLGSAFIRAKIAPKSDSKAQAQTLRFRGAFGTQGNRYQITALAGVADQWKVITSSGRPSPSQDISVSQTTLDHAWLSEKAKAGKFINAVAGDSSGWAAVVSKAQYPQQAYHGYQFDTDLIAKHWSQGYSMTSVAGDQKIGWFFVYHTGTGWGKQRITQPSPFDESRKKWLVDRWNEGYRITSVAGNDLASVTDDGWVFVLTQNTRYTEQLVLGPGPWPTTLIAAKQKDGMRVTGIAGQPGSYLVVLTKGSLLGDQKFSADPSPQSAGFPVNWVKNPQ